MPDLKSEFSNIPHDRGTLSAARSSANGRSGRDRVLRPALPPLGPRRGHGERPRRRDPVQGGRRRHCAGHAPGQRQVPVPAPLRGRGVLHDALGLGRAAACALAHAYVVGRRPERDHRSRHSRQPDALQVQGWV